MTKYLCQFFFDNGWHFAGLLVLGAVFCAAFTFWTPVKVNISQNVSNAKEGGEYGSEMPDSLRRKLAAAVRPKGKGDGIFEPGWGK